MKPPLGKTCIGVIPNSVQAREYLLHGFLRPLNYLRQTYFHKNPFLGQKPAPAYIKKPHIKQCKQKDWRQDNPPPVREKRTDCSRKNFYFWRKRGHRK